MGLRGPELLTPEEFEERCDSYFAELKETGEYPTMTGLAIHMGFASRQSIHDYKQRPGYAQAVSRAALRVENGYERQLANGRGDGGVVFALKNFGWTDKQELDHTSSNGSMSPRDVSMAVIESLKNKHKDVK